MDFFYNDSIELKSSAGSFIGKNTLFLSLQDNDDDNCLLNEAATLIHHRFEVPRFGIDGYKFMHVLERSQISDIIISPVITTTDENLRPLEPKKLESEKAKELTDYFLLQTRLLL
jgi:hypothetical protein